MATLSLVTTASPQTLASIWAIDPNALHRAFGCPPVEAAPETTAALARAYSEMGLASDAIIEALATVHHDHLHWGTMISVLLGTQLLDPEFTSALRAALRPN